MVYFMPALIVYIVAVALLVGGGLEALHWLTIPAPSKVATRAISRQSVRLPKHAEIAEAKTPSQIEAGINEMIDRAPPGARQDQPVPSNAARNTIPNDPYMGNEAKEALQHSLPTEPTPSEHPPAASSEAPATAFIYRPATHRSPRPAVAPSRYVMMTLRTFQFSDGRRLQRLTPFRGAGRSVAYLREQ
jgi:hypothetical protein